MNETTTVTAESHVVDLDVPMRLLTAFGRNGIHTVGDVLRHSEVEILRMRGVGAGSVAALKACLTLHGLALPEYDEETASDNRRRHSAAQERRGTARSIPAGLEGAQWIGRQLAALTEDDRAVPKNALGGRYANATPIEQRRYAWGMYRWAVERTDDQMPDLSKSGDGFNAYPLPGSIELHLEGLNRLAREQLDEAAE